MAGLEEMFALQTLGLAHTLVQKELALRPLAMLPHLKHIKLARTPLVRRLTERRARLIVSNILPELRTMDDVAMPSTHGAYRGLKATASQEEAANHFGFGVQPLFDTAPAGPEAADSAQVQLDAAPKAALVALLGIAKESMDEAPGEGAAGLEAFLRDASENTHAMSCEEEVRSIFYDLSASQGTSARQSADGSQAGSQAAASVEQLWSSLNSSSPGKQPAGAALRPTLSKAASPAKHHKSPRALHKKQALLKARLSPPQHAPAGPLRSGTLETPRNIASAQAEQGQAFLAWSPARAREAMGWTSQTNSPRLSSMEMPSRSSSLQRSILKTATQQAADGSSGLALQVLSAHPDLALPSPDVYAQVVQLLSGAAGASAAQARHSSDSMPASVRVSESGFSPPYPRKQAAWQDQPDTSPPRGLDQLSAEEERAGRPPQRQHSAMASPAPQEATYAGLSKAVSAPVDPNDFGQHPCTSDKPALLYYDQPVDADGSTGCPGGDIFTQAAVDWAPGSGAAGEDDGLIKALKQAISYKRRNLEETHAY
ncbi:hypothetical protein WJX72_010438 [[Myrmecia] bisecta]|uniref:Uncharacterized protein n=1 Tax=[Myrmecia] bisecta TaxID=41462 RepID=A0AAW1QGP4_9CHLO